jgi:hypothetical protein
MYWRIAYRDFLVHKSLVSGNPDSPISDERNPDTFQDADTCPAEING